jgi:hypothetical protein
VGRDEVSSLHAVHGASEVTHIEQIADDDVRAEPA